MEDLIKVPVRFIIDMDERALPTPEYVKGGGAYWSGRRQMFKPAWIKRNDPALTEVISDAKFYADIHGPDEAPHIKAAAKALLKALAKQGVEV
jgi:hypothetical protein